MKLSKVWYQQHKWIWLLLPLSILFVLLSWCRRRAYQTGLFRSHRVDAPVIVVGNISVGGNGKTPTVIAIAQFMQKQGLLPGILSRGYGGRQQNFPHVVTEHDSAELVGDEPRLMAQRVGCPVVIDPKRPRGAKRLIEQGCNVIICDDGLQHYALQRDVEIVVMDGRGIGNGFRLPMGPLRESVQRLQEVDAIIINADTRPDVLNKQADDILFHMTFAPMLWQNVRTGEQKDLGHKFVNASAIAGIGDPQRFFNTCEQLGLSLERCIAFNDHHQYTSQDLPAGDVLMTEKDAVKLLDSERQDLWYLPINGTIAPLFYDVLWQKITTIMRTKETK